MFSLADQLSKFENSTFEAELQNKITIHNRFSGSGVTIKDLVEQNNFIVMQLRKMKESFHSYFKLNDRLYKKLLEHQHNFAMETQNLKAMSLSVQQKVNQSIIIIKELNEKTVVENIKTQNRLEKIIDPLLLQINTKADLETVQLKFQKIKQENIQLIKTVKSIERDQLAQNGFPVNSTVFSSSAFKERISEHYQSSAAPLKIQIQSHKENIHKISDQIYYCTERIRDLEDGQQIIKQHQKLWQKQMDQIKLDLINQINQKINYKMLNDKLSQFYQSQITPSLIKLSKEINNQLYNLQESLIQIKQNNNQKESKISNITKNVQRAFQQINKLTNQLKKQNSLINQLQNKNQKIQKQFQQKLEYNFNYFNTEFENNNRNIGQKIEKMEFKLQKAIQQIQFRVLKQTKAKLSYQIKQLDHRTFKVTQMTSGIMKRIVNCENNFENLKEIICTKANFTDLMKVYEEKASKLQITNLSQKIQKSSHKLQSYTKTEGNSLSKTQYKRKSIPLNRKKVIINSSLQDNLTALFTWSIGQQDVKQQFSKNKKISRNSVKTELIYDH